MHTKPCPCGSQLPYENCCGPFHRGDAIAPTAEALMRSRYSAFALNNTDYLLKTLHPSKHKPNEAELLAQSFQDTEWTGLVILNRSAGTETDSAGTVEFVAHYRSGQRQASLHECSRFVKENQQWFYVDGDLKQARSPGRNDPCWCGSGKKFKKCHG